MLKAAVVWAPCSHASFSPLQGRLRGAVGEESASRWLLYSILKSHLAFTGKNLSPAVEKWLAEPRARAAGKRKISFHLGLGWSCLLNSHLLATFHILLLTFVSLFFLMQKIWKLDVLGGCAPPPEGSLSS